MEVAMIAPRGQGAAGRAAATLLLALALALAGCAASGSAGAGSTPSPQGTSTPTGPSGPPVAYDARAGHVIVQLFPAFGLVTPPDNGIPQWTLYGNGVLIFHPLPGDTGPADLREAQLTPAQVQHILDVVVNQRHFFQASAGFYGQNVPDTGALLLQVQANQQTRTITLGAGPGPNPDAQTRDLFAIAIYLEGYQPADAVSYAPPGVALIVHPGAAPGTGSTAWPYSDISLSDVAAQECPYTQPDTRCPQRSNGPAGIVPLMGTRGVDLLRSLGPRAVVTQAGASYLIAIWPLLPDVQPAGPRTQPMIRVTHGRQLTAWPLTSVSGLPNSGT
jgi:hypothetical protein